MDTDWKSLFILLVCMFAPAIIFVVVFSVLRVRRGKFQRQRITKGSTHRKKPAS